MRTDETEIEISPFLKWLGRKDTYAKYILPLIPKPTGPAQSYYEPFLGSGAIAGILASSHYDFHYVLNEGNRDLYYLYSHLINNCEGLIEQVKEFYANGKDQYYAYRSLYNVGVNAKNIKHMVLKPDDMRRAALFIYFNRFGFNGLCRYNAQGLFNVPVGNHKSYYLPEKEMRAWGTWLRTYPWVTLTQGDFANCIFTVQRGDVVYLDPPYYPLSETSNFVSYGGAQWLHDKDHVRLADEAQAAAKIGATVIVSNSDVSVVREMYSSRGAEIITLPPIQRFISSKERTKVGEILAVWR